MNRTSRSTVVVGGGVGVAAIILTAIAISQIKKLSLPFPIPVAVLNIIIPVLGVGAALLVQQLPDLKRNVTTRLLTALATASTFVPFALLVLSFVYGVPSDERSCTSEVHWARMFRNKDDAAIRAIQERLQCCGFNSIHDRAWPFPSSSQHHDATACETTLHYMTPCVNRWLHQQSTVASMVGFASFLNWLLLVYMLPDRPVAGRRERRLLLSQEPEEHRPLPNTDSYRDDPVAR